MDTKEVVIGQILDKLESVKPASIVMIGDKASDIRAGQAYGLHTVGVCYGYGSKEELEHAKPDAIVETVEELENTLLGRHWL